MCTFDVAEPVREEEANIVVWLIGIIQGKSTMDGFDRLVTVERGDKIYFRTTNNEEFDWWLMCRERPGDSVEDGYLDFAVIALIKSVNYD